MNRTVVLALAMSVAIVSCTQTYQLIDLGVQPGFDTCEPTGINSFGQVSGFSSRNNGSFRRAIFYDRLFRRTMNGGDFLHDILLSRLKAPIPAHHTCVLTFS